MTKLTSPQEVRQYAQQQAKLNRKPETIETMKAYELAAGLASRFMFPDDFDGLKATFANYKNTVNPAAARIIREIAEML